VYSVGYGPSAHRRHSQRTARDRAGFFLPFLRPDMRLLDCGCGPGSITLGFAEASSWMPVWSCVLRCVFGARVLGNGLLAYDEARCYGCGLCVTTCPERAISLVPRPRA